MFWFGSADYFVNWQDVLPFPVLAQDKCQKCDLKHAPSGLLANATLHENVNFNFIRDIAPVVSIERDAFVPPH